MEKLRQENLDDKDGEMKRKIQVLKEKWTKILRQDPDGASAARSELAKRLREKYGGQEGCREYVAFQIIADGSFDPAEDTPHFDFPGDDSIEKNFLDPYLEKIKQ
jgi:hypothetical protein